MKLPSILVIITWRWWVILAACQVLNETSWDDTWWCTCSVAIPLLQFSTYEVVHKTLSRYRGPFSDSKGKGANAVNFVSGCAAGVSGTLASFPFDVMRTRLISQGEPKVHAFVYIHVHRPRFSIDLLISWCVNIRAWFLVYDLISLNSLCPSFSLSSPGHFPLESWPDCADSSLSYRCTPVCIGPLWWCTLRME